MRMCPQGIRVTQPELRDAQKVDLDFLFAAAGEVEIEAGLDLGRDRFLSLAVVDGRVNRRPVQAGKSKEKMLK
jgi:hypothetical protein